MSELMVVYPNTHPGDELLVGYVMSLLEAAQVASVEEHLLVCERCQNTVRLIDCLADNLRKADFAEPADRLQLVKSTKSGL